MAQVDYYFARYGDLELHRRMVSDRRRTQAFAEALYRSISPDTIVLDVGTGTGILAMLAARAGARRVYAVDCAEIIEVARELVRTNGLEGVVEVIRGAAEEVSLGAPVDLIVSEWLGNFALVESMLEDVIAARDRNLSSRGKMIPASVAVMLAPLDDGVLYADDGPGYWRNLVHGLDLTALEKLELAQGKAWQRFVEPGALLASGQPLVTLDLRTARASDACARGCLVFRAMRDGVLNGFCGWFVAELSDAVTLDTAPGLGATHWAQTYVPFIPRRVEKGERIRVEYELEPDPQERRHQRLRLVVDGVEQQCSVE